MFSYLQAVQVAIDDSLNKLEKANPEKRAILVTFNNKVTVVGDGKADKIVIDGNSLDDQEQIRLAHQRSPPYETMPRSRDDKSFRHG